jgi:hypothetical protein
MVNNIIMNTIMIMTTKDISINKNFYENLRWTTNKILVWRLQCFML